MNRKRLYLALALNALIIAGEFTGGVLIQSVGLISDAWHNLIDQGSLFLTLYAHLLAARPATARKTFGYHRVGVLTALINAVVLVGVAVGLSILAVKRIRAPIFVPGGPVMGIALFSFAANFSIALLLQRAAKQDLNIRSAFSHMLGDAWVCLSVVFSGLVILKTHWYILDPLISLVVVGAILASAWPILRESTAVLLNSVPRELDAEQIQETIRTVPGVQEVHDFHLWCVKPGFPILTCHVLIQSQSASQMEAVLQEIRSRVSKQYGIWHVTVQTETACNDAGASSCGLE